MMVHHEFGPSGRGRRQLCPGSWALEAQAKQKGLAIEGDTEAAEEGTRLHSYLPPDKDLVSLSDEQKVLVLNAREFVSRQINTLDSDDVRYEDFLNIFDSSGKKHLTYGWADITILAHPAVIDRFPDTIIDLKFGRLPIYRELVEPAQEAYALGLHQKYASRKVKVYVKEVRSGIEYSAEYEDWEGIALKIEQEIRACTELTHEFHASPAACQYCTAKAICPALHSTMVPALFKDPVLDITPEVWAQKMEMATMAESWAKFIKAAAAQEVDAGRLTIPGYERLSRKVRQIKDLPGLLGAVSALLKEDDWLPAISASISELEKIYAHKWADRSELGTIKEGIEDFKDLSCKFVRVEEQKYFRSTNRE